MTDMRAKLVGYLRAYRAQMTYIAVIVMVYLLFFALGVTCPIKHILGISCPGCGMSRAWFHAITFRLAEAWNYHPLFWIVPIAALAWLGKQKYPRLGRCVLWITAGLMLLVYLLRMIDLTDSVVVFAPMDGAIGKIIQWILQ
jgi:hypothetical protein